MNNVLLFMCLMGTLSYMCYLLLCGIFRQKYSAGQRLLSLSITWCFYVIPLPLIIPWLSGKLTAKIPSIPSFSQLQANEIIPASKLITITPDGKVHWPIYSKIFLTAAAVWLVILAALLLYHIRKYIKERKKWMSVSEAAPEEISSYVSTLPGSTRFPEIRVRILPSDIPPFVMGYFRPVLFLPPLLIHTKNEDIIRHELCHVSRRHNIIKLAGLLAAILHWYCPAGFCFFLSLSNTLELVCDKKVLSGASDLRRNAYVHQLISFSAWKEAETISDLPASSFKSTHFHMIKERLLMIRHIHKKPSVLSALFVIFSIPLCTLPVFAYRSVVVEGSSDYLINENSNTISVFVPLGEECPEIFAIPDMITHFGPSDCYFESDEGEIYYYNDENAAAIPAADCVHEYMTGYFFKHEFLSDGSCNVYKYESRRCKICTYVDRVTLVNSLYYNVCPH